MCLSLRTSCAVVVAAAVLSFLAADDASAAQATQSGQPAQASQVKNGGEPTSSNTQPILGAIGPKRIVAVQKFEPLTSFDSAYSDWDVGGGLSAMLVSALIQSGHYVVVERANMDTIKYEQDLTANKAVSAATGAQPGQLIGAQFLIFGAVTELGQQDQGNSTGIGIDNTKNSTVSTGLNVLSALTGSSSSSPTAAPSNGISVGTKSTSGSIAIDLRVVDATTGQVIQSKTVRDTVTSKDFNLIGGYKGIAFGDGKFASSPIGQLARKVIEEAVKEITATADKVPWQGLVVAADNGEVIINAGKNFDIHAGDRFTIQHVAQKLTDPATGELLSYKLQPLGELHVTEVEDKISTGAFTASGAVAPQRGDVVIWSK